MNLEINKAEITSGMFLKWEYTEYASGRETQIKAKSDAPIHEDLSNAIAKLTPHFVLITEMKKKSEVASDIDLESVPEKLMKKFQVKGFTEEQVQGETIIKITGTKLLKNGKAISFETPKTDRGSDEDAYEFFDQLIDTVESIKEEILAFMDGKQAESNQTNMFDGFEPETDASEDQPLEQEEFEQQSA